MSRCTVGMLLAWLLMEPELLPLPDGRVTLDLDRPVRTWEQVASYDSAADCERARVKLWNDTEKKLGAHKSKPGTPEYVGWARGTTGRCVPSDHVYPPAPLPQSK